MPSDADLNSIIVAEDNAMLRSILRSFLDECGFRVLLATNGMEAVALASSTEARLVLLDVKMPQLDGLQACAWMRSLPNYASVPIVMVSAYGDAATRAAAESAGATLFLGKPISIIGLLEAIQPLLGKPVVERNPAFEWKRRTEPKPVYGEVPELAHGRKLLEICRRSSVAPDALRRPDWFR